MIVSLISNIEQDEIEQNIDTVILLTQKLSCCSEMLVKRVVLDS